MRDERVERIAKHYKLKHQLKKLVEESFELIGAALAYLFLKKTEDRKDHLIEEAADVAIVIAQIVYLLKSDEKMEVWIDYKLDRTIKRMEAEKWP